MLALQPDELLGYKKPADRAGDALGERRGRLAAFAAVMQALAATPALRGTAPGPGEPNGLVKQAEAGQPAAVSPGPPDRA